MIVVSSRGNGGCRRRPSAFHNLRSASASAISVRTPYLVNRQSDVYEREGIDLDVSTLADWVDAAAATLMPLVDVIRDHVFAAERVRADDTTVRVLAKSKTRVGRLWTYVRDDARHFNGHGRPGSAESECAAAGKFAHYRPGISL